MLSKYCWLLLFTFLLQWQCYAHEGRPVFIDILENERGLYRVRWKIPPVMPAQEVPFVTLKGGNCRQVSGSNKAALHGLKQYQCDSEKNRVSIQYPANNPALSTLIHLKNYKGETFSLFSGPDTLDIDLPTRLGAFELATQYINAGFEHILRGYDHLVFVLCLMQIALGLRRLLLTITGFTLAHSITLFMASLGFINIRIETVEVLIALSIVMLAVEITKAMKGKKSPSLIWKYPALVATLFGLLHGLGFASALGELGLPQTMQIPALAFFNIGVELGQLTFVACVLLILGLAKGRFAFFRNLKQVSATLTSLQFPVAFLYMVGTVSTYWFVDRFLNLFV